MATIEGPPCPLGTKTKPCGRIVKTAGSPTWHCNRCYKRWSDDHVKALTRAMTRKRPMPRPSPETQVRLPEGP